MYIISTHTAGLKGECIRIKAMQSRVISQIVK